MTEINCWSKLTSQNLIVVGATTFSRSLTELQDERSDDCAAGCALVAGWRGESWNFRYVYANMRGVVSIKHEETIDG